MYVGTADLIVLETELARIEIGKPILISHLKADRQRFYQLGGPDDSTAMKYTKCIAAIESQKTRSFAHLTPGIARRAERYVGICLEEGVAQVFNRLKGQYEPDIEVRGFWWRGVGSLDGGSGIRYYIRGAGRPFFSRVVVIA